jgi:hypothetical protein
MMTSSRRKLYRLGAQAPQAASASHDTLDFKMDSKLRGLTVERLLPSFFTLETTVTGNKNVKVSLLKQGKAHFVN